MSNRSPQRRGKIEGTEKAFSEKIIVKNFQS